MCLVNSLQRVEPADGRRSYSKTGFPPRSRWISEFSFLCIQMLSRSRLLLNRVEEYDTLTSSHVRYAVVTSETPIRLCQSYRRSYQSQPYTWTFVFTTNRNLVTMPLAGSRILIPVCPLILHWVRDRHSILCVKRMLGPFNNWRSITVAHWWGPMRLLGYVIGLPSSENVR